MSSVTEFWKFIQRKLMGGNTYEVTSDDINEFIDKRELNRLAIFEFAIHSGINFIANALSKCEIRTFENWNEVQKDQYYRWNYEPNINMNSSQFMHKLVWSLIYRKECLVIQNRKGEFLIADSYQHDRYAMKQDLFRNVTVCSDDGYGVYHPFTFNKTFRMEDVLFYRLSNRNISAMMDQLVDGYNNLMQSAIQKFYKAGGERGVMAIDANAVNANYGTKSDGTPRTFNDVYTELLNKQFASYFKSPNAVLPLFKGFDYQVKGNDASKKSTSELKDIMDITDEIYGMVGNALQIPPALLRGDVSDVSVLTRNMITFAIDPIANVIQKENNRKLYQKSVLDGYYQMVDTSSIMHMTAAELAAASDKMISCGGWNIDDIRKKAGDAPLNTEWSRKHFLTKNYDEITSIGLQKEGENQEGGNDGEA